MTKTASGLPASLLKPVLADQPTESNQMLVRLGAAGRALASAKTLDEVASIRDMAEAARVYAKAAHLGREMQNDAAEVKLRAERKGGEILASMGEKRGGAKSRGETLKPLGIDKNESSRWQAMAGLREPEFESYIHDTRERGGELTSSRVLRIARDETAQATKDDKAARTAQALALPSTADIRTGDFREALADVADGSVDAIITDPPYPKEFLSLFEELAAFADRVLAPDGVLAVMSGQSHLPAVFEAMDGHRPYRWTMAYMTPGAGYASHARRVQSNWKPVLIYGYGPRFGDVVTSDGADKRLHAWGQDYTAFSSLVERLTEPSALVCDPFLGAGTTALAALSLGRRFIGCDIDEAAVASTTERLAVSA